MANYIKRENTIHIPDTTKLTKQDRADIALYKEFGYEISITRKKKVKKPQPGNKKVELIYYIENEMPDKLDEFLVYADEETNFMKASTEFKKWYKAKTGKDYAGQAADLIKKNGAAAAERIKELEAKEEEKREARKAEKKKAKK